MTEEKTNIVVDIWGGNNSCIHIARSNLPIQQALEMARQELLAGFLVNLRADSALDNSEDFDSRSKSGAS